MNKTHDRRFLGMLVFLAFLGFLGFLGTENDHLAKFASFASLASFAFIVFIPRQASTVDPRYRLDRVSDIFLALVGRQVMGFVPIDQRSLASDPKQVL